MLHISIVLFWIYEPSTTTMPVTFGSMFFADTLYSRILRPLTTDQSLANLSAIWQKK